MKGIATPIIWHISDGRPGHDNQGLGLIEALRELRPLRSITLPAPRPARLIKIMLTRRWPDEPPRPDVIIAAGHATHLPALLAARLHRTKTVLLMRPSLPCSWFDYCLIPRHDGVPPSARVLLTSGALNRIRPASNQDERRGLMLIGGASRHYHEDTAALLAAIETITGQCREICWRISDSARSTAAISTGLQALQGENIEYIPWRDCPPDWVAQQLGRARQVWVSEDSISMLYEALSAGAQLGLLPMPRKGRSRLHQATDALIAQGKARRYADWRAHGELPPAQPPLQEASRCAALLLRGGLFARAAKA